MRIRAVYQNNVFTRFKGLRAVTPIILMHITIHVHSMIPEDQNNMTTRLVIVS